MIDAQTASVLQQLFGHMNIAVSLNDLLNLVTGNPVTIQVDPATVPNVLGKNLVISFQQNAIQVQLH